MIFFVSSRPRVLTLMKYTPGATPGRSTAIFSAGMKVCKRSSFLKKSALEFLR